MVVFNVHYNGIKVNTIYISAFFYNKCFREVKNALSTYHIANSKRSISQTITMSLQSEMHPGRTILKHRRTCSISFALEEVPVQTQNKEADFKSIWSHVKVKAFEGRMLNPELWVSPSSRLKEKRDFASKFSGESEVNALPFPFPWEFGFTERRHI